MPQIEKIDWRQTLFYKVFPNRIYIMDRNYSKFLVDAKFISAKS